MNESLAQVIITVRDLSEWLKQFPDEMELDVRFDSGYGYGGFTPSSFFIKDGKLRIEVS